MKPRLTHLLFAAAITVASPATAETTIRAVLQAGISGLDPIWTTANVVADHGAMVYDTLFGIDDSGTPQPQMVDTYTVSPDKLTWRFHLRPGLKFSDGTPVTAKDCVQSLKRWAARDSAGQLLMGKAQSLTAIDSDTFELKLTIPYGLVLETLGKNSTQLPFMMREKEALTDPNQQITETIGSGPFLFLRDQWNPGNKAIYVKNPAYIPRAEPPSGLAGGKVVKIDRVELLAIPDAATAHQALIKGEVDFLEIVNLDLLPTLKIPGIKTEVFNKGGTHGVLRMNHLLPPFDNPKAREAMLWLIDQEAYMNAVIGDPEYWSVCGSIFSCGSPMESKAGVDWVRGHSVAKARALFKEAGYDGRPVVILDPTDYNWFHQMAQVTASLLKEAGVNVRIEAMDWATVFTRRASKAPADKGGWNIFHTGYGGTNALGPIGFSHMPATCEKAWFGWPCDPKIEELRQAWADAAPGPARQKAMDALQVRNFEVGIVVPTGQWVTPSAYRTNLSGWVKVPDTAVFWGVEKK